MGTLIQLSAMSWLNMDTVTLIRQEGQEWRVWVCGQETPLTLTAEEGKTMEHYVTRQSEKTAFNLARPRHP